ncbi:MAG: hypothetical protein Q4E57_06735 [Eubacteriales bacterium]|nr:hypothetical protein [Eubacteriales bacterium]
MEYAELTLKMPKQMTYFFKSHDPQSIFETNAMILYPYIQNQTISNGCAAEMLGIDKWSLIEFYEKNGLMGLETTIEDYLHDIDTIRRVKGSEK